MNNQLSDLKGDEPLPPITGSGHLTLPALTASGRGCVTKKAAVWWGVLVSALASAATGLTSLWGWPWWASVGAGFVVGAVVAYFVRTSKQVAA